MHAYTTDTQQVHQNNIHKATCCCQRDELTKINATTLQGSARHVVLFQCAILEKKAQGQQQILTVNLVKRTFQY